MNSERITLLNQQIKQIEIRQQILVFSPFPYHEVKDELISLQEAKEFKELELSMIKPVKINFAIQLMRYASMLFV